MGYPVQQSTTARPLMFLMLDSADHITPKTGLTPTVTLSKNGAAFASPAGAVTELANGWYKVAGNATDNNTLGPITLHATAAGADPTDEEYLVTAYDPTAADANVAAIKAKTDNLPADPASASTIASSFSTISSTLATIAGYIDTEVAAIKTKTDNLPSDPADASDIAASFTSIASTLSTIASYIDTEVAAIKAKTDNLPTNTSTRLDAIDTAIDALPTNSELATALAGADDATLAAIATIMTSALTESYAADGANATPAQLLYEIRGLLSEFAISGTMLTVRKKDGSTTAATYTLDSATSPTSITRSS